MKKRKTWGRDKNHFHFQPWYKGIKGNWYEMKKSKMLIEHLSNKTICLVRNSISRQNCPLRKVVEIFKTSEENKCCFQKSHCSISFYIFSSEILEQFSHIQAWTLTVITEILSRLCKLVTWLNVGLTAYSFLLLESRSLEGIASLALWGKVYLIWPNGYFLIFAVFCLLLD